MQPKANTKKWRQRLGSSGENLAADYLKGLGYELLETNYHAGRRGELDLILRAENLLLFAEVKTRLSTEIETGQMAVGSAKQRKIVSSALFYLQNEAQRATQIRFDVILINFKSSYQVVKELVESDDYSALQKLAEIIHIEDAFGTL